MKITKTKMIFTVLIQALLCLDFAFSAEVKQEDSLSPMIKIEYYFPWFYPLNAIR